MDAERPCVRKDVSRQGEERRDRTLPGDVVTWLRVVAAVGRRPGLWGVAVRQVGRLAAPGWWRRWPPVPAPDPAYLRFRLQTAYGDPDHPPEPDDVIAYLRWCKRWGNRPGSD